MLNIIKELRIWLNAEADKACDLARKYVNDEREYDEQYGRMKALSATIQKLDSLLNAEVETNGEKDCKNDGNAV